MFLNVLIIALLLPTLNGHSWVECTKYYGDPASFDWNDCDAKGKPRPLSDRRNVGQSFGQDIGFDYRPGNNNAPCQGNSQRFQENYPNGVVEYQVGETYTLAWPAKNHVAAQCTNQFIPDTFLKLYMTPYSENQQDPTQDVFKQNQVPASFSDTPHEDKTIDFEGFQKCPDFCGAAGTDRATCTGTFSIPANTAPGLYTLQWYWAFNGQQDLYSTCWEARVLPSDGNNNNNNNNNNGNGNTNNASPVCDSSVVICPAGWNLDNTQMCATNPCTNTFGNQIACCRQENSNNENNNLQPNASSSTASSLATIVAGLLVLIFMY